MLDDPDEDTTSPVSPHTQNNQQSCQSTPRVTLDDITVAVSTAEDTKSSKYVISETDSSENTKASGSSTKVLITELSDGIEEITASASQTSEENTVSLKTQCAFSMAILFLNPINILSIVLWPKFSYVKEEFCYHSSFIHLDINLMHVKARILFLLTCVNSRDFYLCLIV